MKKMSDIAIRECVAELCAATRRPIDPSAVDTVVGWLRPQFEKILDRLDGPKRWAEHGERLRENSRHTGALADFFGSHAGVTVVGITELSHAMKLIRADCTVRSERTPLAYQYCPPAPVDATAAEAFLRSLAPERPLSRAS
jgi:hypothetical protein